MSLSAEELINRLEGILCFPVTPYRPDGAIDRRRFETHLDYLLSFAPGAVFPGCGTGEFPALTFDESEELTRSTVALTGGKIPVVAGVGYGTRQAVELARRLESAGADGLLVMPPQDQICPQQGLYSHYRAIAEATRLGVILYQRGSVRFTIETLQRLAELPNVVGLKDGTGELENLQRLKLAVDGKLQMFNGMPTAELSVPAFAGLGIERYSSAVFNFVPEVATAFYNAFKAGDLLEVERLLGDFYTPLTELRDEGYGYAVSIIRAGVAIRHGGIGRVRSPLVDITGEQMIRLESLISKALASLK